MSYSGPPIAIVQWDADAGGAQAVAVELALSLKRLGVHTEMVFIVSGGSFEGRLRDARIPFHVLGLPRGRSVLLHPRRYAKAVERAGPGGVLVTECGFIGTALRLGGYRAPIVAVENGALLLPSSAVMRLIRRLSRMAAAWADDVEVAVSDFMLERMLQAPHARRTCRIYNGIAPDRFEPKSSTDQAPAPRELRVAFAARLVAGKGADHLIRAVSLVPDRVAIELAIAGDGPERPRLEALAETLELGGRVRFLGKVADVDSLWAACDIAVIASDQFTESFGMTALEAMAAGKPLIATRNGALSELVLDGVTGTIVPTGDPGALADAIVAYADRPTLRTAHGAAGRQRAIEMFSIDDCARAYLRCFESVSSRGSG